MSPAEALDIVVARTGHARYRELCADPYPDAAHWRRRILAMAGEPPPTSSPPALPPLDATMGRLAEMHACPYRAVDAGCGCSGARCGLRPRAAPPVSHRDCFACLESYGGRRADPR